MSYVQRFGLSRKSPFNVSVDTKKKKEEAPASEIIEKNNKDSFAQVGKDIFNQVKDNFKNKSTLGKLGVIANAVVSGGKSLPMDLVDTSKLDQDKLDEAQDYITIGSGAVGTTGFGQIPSAIADLSNTAFSAKRAFDNFSAGKSKRGIKNVKDTVMNALAIVPVAGEYQAVQKGYKYGKKGLTAAGLAPEGSGGRVYSSATSFPTKMAGKMVQMLAKMRSK